MLILALLALACTPAPTPKQVAEKVISGEMQAASEMGNAEWAEAMNRWDALMGERKLLRAAEREIAMAQAKSAVDNASWGEAVNAVRIGLQAAPEDPEFEALAGRIEEVAVLRDEGGNPGGAAAIYEGLSMIWASKPEIAAAHLARAQALAVQAGISQRYAATNLEDTLAAQRGIQPVMATATVESVHAEFVVEPDLGALVQRARERIAQLTVDDNARTAFPDLASGKLAKWLSGLDGSDTLELADATAQLEKLIGRAHKLGGIPVETATYEVADAAIGGLDPWTRVIWPAEVASWEAHHAGVYYGVGLHLAVDAAQDVLVEFPIPGSPADDAGIHQGDRVDSIGGKDHHDVRGDDRKQAFEQALLGDDGSDVEVTVERGGERKDFQLKRKPIYPDVVVGWERKADNSWNWWLDEEAGVAYVKIVAFKAHTDEALDEALANLEPQSVVVDLRANPGGDVNAAVNVVDRFVAEGTLARLEGRVPVDAGPDVDPETGEKLAAWNEGIPGHALEGLPVVVLVDGQTSSSGEIVAGGLQELANADVIGARTYGKGLSQALRTDPERGYALQFTNLYWALPSGRKLDRSLAESHGVEPAFADSFTPAERFSVAVAARQRGYARSHADGTPIAYASTVGRADLPPLNADPHVERALLILRARRVLSESLE